MVHRKQKSNVCGTHPPHNFLHFRTPGTPASPPICPGGAGRRRNRDNSKPRRRAAAACAETLGAAPELASHRGVLAQRALRERAHFEFWRKLSSRASAGRRPARNFSPKFKSRPRAFREVRQNSQVGGEFRRTAQSFGARGSRAAPRFPICAGLAPPCAPVEVIRDLPPSRAAR